MSKPIRHTDTSPGWINRKFKEHERELRQQKSAKKLQAATIGKGGLTVKGDAGIAVEDGGNLVLNGGGSVVVNDGGAFYATYSDSSHSSGFGPLQAVSGVAGHGLFVGRPTTGKTVFAAARMDSGMGLVQIGSGTQDAELFLAQTIDTNIYASNQAFVAGANYSVMRADGAGVYLRGSIDGSTGVMIEHTTTAAAANCVIDAGTSRIYRSTSSRRYKQDIDAAEVDVEAVLALQPRRFRSKAEVETLGDDAPTHVGFIAEEAADLGLDAWVTRDAEGPEAFSYATWAVALQAVNQHQAQQIADLTARLERLEQAQPTQG